MANVQSRRAPRMGRSNTGTVAALDIGCSKITCLIGRNDGAGPRSFRILGAGRQQSRGFTGGTITDMEGRITSYNVCYTKLLRSELCR